MPRRPSYSCRQFRLQHVEYVDGFLGDDALHACETHLEECPRCRRHDVQVRRSLLALQVLPVIEPSADFRRRLGERIAAESAHNALVQRRGARWGVATAILAASVALLASANARPAALHKPSAAPIRVLSLLNDPETPFSPASSGAGPTGIGAPGALHALRERGRTIRFAKAPERSVARFEPVPGQALLRAVPRAVPVATARLQTAAYIGQ